MTADSSGLTGGAATATVAIEVEGKNTARVQKFDPAGSLVTGWGGTPAPGELDGTTCLLPRLRQFPTSVNSRASVSSRTALC